MLPLLCLLTSFPCFFHDLTHHRLFFQQLFSLLSTCSFLDILQSQSLCFPPSFLVSFLSPLPGWAQCRVILLLSLSLSGAALQGPADWIRAFYSLWADHRAQMQITTGVESVPQLTQDNTADCLRVTTQHVLYCSLGLSQKAELY